MKVRLKQSGFEAYNGPIGGTKFENGLSTADVTERDFLRLSAVMKVEREDGTTKSPIDVLTDAANIGAPTGEAARAAELESNAVALAKVKADAAPVEPSLAAIDAQTNGVIYTEAELGAIADKEGIKGLRKIAEPLGIKGNSIKDLIVEILQAKKA